MNTLVWCVECEKMVEMEIVRLKNVEFCGHVVEFNVLTDGGEVAGAELDFCEFPLGFAFVAPPDVQPDWIEHVVEPGESDLDDETNFNSLELGQALAYFGYELAEA